MINDCQGKEPDEATALRRMVAVLELRFPRHNTPGDRLGRLLEEIGELSATVMTLEGDAAPVLASDRPEAIAVKELQDVLCAIGGVAHHYDLPIKWPAPDDCQGDPYLLLALLVQAAGVIADAVHQLIGMGAKRENHGPPNPHQLAWALEMAIVRTLRLTDHFGLRDGLRRSIESSYQDYQRNGFLKKDDGADR